MRVVFAYNHNCFYFLDA